MAVLRYNYLSQRDHLREVVYLHDHWHAEVRKLDGDGKDISTHGMHSKEALPYKAHYGIMIVSTGPGPE